MKITCEGLTATEQYLTVHVTVHLGNAIRFSQVRVPITLLLHDSITSQMDRAVRRGLIEAWSEVDLADPLF